MTKKAISSTIRTGGFAIPNPEYLRLHKEMKPVMDKLADMERATQEAARLTREIRRLEKEIETAPSKHSQARAEALLAGNTALALQDPTEDLRRELKEVREQHELWDGPVKKRLRAEIEQIVLEHPEWESLAEEKALVGAEREQELLREIEEIRKNREVAYAMVRWLRRPERGVTGLPHTVRQG